MEGEDRDAKKLLDRLAQKPEPPQQQQQQQATESSWWGWGSSLVNVDSWTKAVESVVSEAQTAGSSMLNKMNETLEQVGKQGGSVLDDLGKQAAWLGTEVERALGLAEAPSHEGFEVYFAKHGGAELTRDVSELSERCGVALNGMSGLQERERAAATLAAQAWKRETDDDGVGNNNNNNNSNNNNNESSSSSTNNDNNNNNNSNDNKQQWSQRAASLGCDVSEIVEAAKQHGTVLLEAHNKLVAELKASAVLPVEEKEERIARVAVESKVRMQELYALGQMELLKRAAVLVTREADKLLSACPQIDSAIETGKCEFSGAVGAPEKEQVEQRLRVLLGFLNHQFRRFQKNYSGLVGSLDDVVRPFCDNEELLEALKQLTKVTEAEIVVDAEAACQIVERMLSLLENIFTLLLLIKRV